MGLKKVEGRVRVNNNKEMIQKHSAKLVMIRANHYNQYTITMSVVDVSHSMDLVDKFKSNKNEPLYNVPPEEYNTPLKKSSVRRPTFQRAMKLTLLIGQCFGLNPVLGIFETDATKLRFKIYSGRCLYSIFSIVGQTCLLSLCMFQLMEETKANLASNSSLVFYGTNCLTTILFLRIATKWPKLCQHIARMEAADPNTDVNLVKKCKISCIVVLSLALVEHLLSDVSGIALAIDCQPNTNLYEAFSLQSFPWLWSYVAYNPVLGLLAQLINFQCTFNWNFSDTFVICISWYLTARLQQVNEKVVAMRGKIVPATFWRAIREDYSKATNLVRRVDDVISGVIFISFANNVFFICLQLLHTLELFNYLRVLYFREGIKPVPSCHDNLEGRPFRGYEQATYFVFSLVFLILRSLTVSLVVAQVHSASLEPAKSLYDVPSASYCVEVQRFLDQIHGDTVALSGLQFFKVKRGLVLTIAGTIVTYELVLMQFTGVNPTVTPPRFIPISTTTTNKP